MTVALKADGAEAVRQALLLVSASYDRLDRIKDHTLHRKPMKACRWWYDVVLGFRFKQRSL
jgi:hypothetical protein